MIIIKSQCGESIGKYVEVKISESVVKGFSKFGSVTVLGNYKSRERALEVLNDITKQIKKGTVKDYLDGGYRIKQDYVYFMPNK